MNEKSRQICCTTTIEMLVELQTLGSQIYVPEKLVDAGYVQRPPQIAPVLSLFITTLFQFRGEKP